MSTFLLEMALDEAHVRERLSKRLLAERERRGGGNARRFPQPRMAETLGVTLRTYQDWEGGIRVPSWRNLEEIADRLDIPLGDIVGEEPETTTGESSSVEARLDRIEAQLAEIRGMLAAAAQGEDEPPSDEQAHRV